MKQPRMGRVFCPVALVCLLAGCATSAAPGISGRWTPVNRFDLAPAEIPLSPAYLFYAAPMDRTLKTMLARWALDSKMTLVYQHPSDFTLYEPVSDIHTGDLRDAVATLTNLYAVEHVAITVEGGAIVVRRNGSDTSKTGGLPSARFNAPPKTSVDTIAAPRTEGQP